MCTSRRTSDARIDPLEEALADALRSAGVRFVREGHGIPVALDFYLPDFDLYLEVKRFHSDRIARQMSLADNVIAIQGQPAIDWLCSMLSKKA